MALLGSTGYSWSMATAREIRQADERGRVSLGASFANRTFLVEHQGDTIVFRLARVIPEQEAWLYENERALTQVRKGLAQAKRRAFASPPSLDEAHRLADQLDEPDAD